MNAVSKVLCGGRTRKRSAAVSGLCYNPRSFVLVPCLCNSRAPMANAKDGVHHTFFAEPTIAKHFVPCAEIWLQTAMHVIQRMLLNICFVFHDGSVGCLAKSE
jgi:hypothetical protein